jgi:hypothetical protein
VTGHRSPSWSWSTYPHAVVIWKLDKEDAELVGVGVTLASPLAPLSSVTEGWISVRGEVWPWTAVKPAISWQTRVMLDDSGREGGTVMDTDRVLFLGVAKCYR